MTPQTNQGLSFVPAAPADSDYIFAMFEAAIAYQKERGYIGWAAMDQVFLEKDIAQELLYKVVQAEKIVAAFCICYSDALIWRGRERGDALYLHRLVTHPDFRGRQLFADVLDWARSHAQEAGRQYIRMDTWAENHKLIAYYQAYGFRFVEHYRTGADAALPAQHRNLNVALLEFPC